MCGIAGVFGGTLSSIHLRCALEHMADALAHRGPDDRGILVHGEESAGLACQRLSLVGIANGHQPVTNEDGSVAVVFNGEIYNSGDLRLALERRGHRFTTDADTEVIAHLYEDLGTDCFARLEGMFAVALLDRGLRRLVLARDGCGMKQLCYAATPTGFLFASEAKAIFASGLLQPRADWAALDTYLAVGFVPAPASCFAGVRKLAAGSILVVDQSGVREQTFWRMRYRTGRRLSDEEHAQEMLGALRSAVRSHLAAEARIGAYLSGGWDSSILAALAADLVSGRLATFSVVLPDNPSVDERRFSRLMASHLGSEHHEVEFRAADVPRLLPDAVWYREEPFTGPALLELQLASLASRHVKAVLSGQGSDELLGGYPWQQGGERWYRLRAVVPPFAARLAAHAPLSRAWRLPLGILAAGDAAAADAEWMRGLTPVEKDRVLVPGLRGERPDSRPFRCHPDTLASCRDPLQRRMALDLTRRLADGLLATNDRMAMAHSLEVRMPFLDRAVVELSLALPSDLKVRGDQRKVVLGRLVGMLPTEIAARRKFGLQYPLAEYLRGPLRGFVREQLLESPGLGELLNRRAVERMLRRQLGGDHPDMKGLWALVVLAAWWRRFFVDYRTPDGHGPGNAVTR